MSDISCKLCALDALCDVSLTQTALAGLASSR